MKCHKRLQSHWLALLSFLHIYNFQLISCEEDFTLSFCRPVATGPEAEAIIEAFSKTSYDSSKLVSLSTSDIHGLKTSEGHIPGRLKIAAKISPPPSGQHYEMIIIHSEDDRFSGFGRFDPCPLKICPDQQRIDVQLVKLQFLPCVKYYSIEPLPTNMFITNPTTYRPLDFNIKIYILWSYVDSFCNHPEEVTLRISYILTSTSGVRVARTGTGLILKFAKRPLHGGQGIGPLSPIEDISELEGTPPGIESITEINTEKNPKKPECLNSPVPYSQNCNFGKKIVKGLGMPNCRGVESDEYLEFSQYASSRSQDLCFVCPLPLKAYLEPFIKTILPPNSGKIDPNAVDNDTKHGLDADTFPGNNVWRQRIVHGVACTLITLFITPVSIFSTRYMKETLMGRRLIENRVWYIIHILATIMAVQLHIIAQCSAYFNTGLLGRSLHYPTHRIFGWITIAIFIFAFLSGGFRPFESMGRISLVASHSIGGILYYFCSLICLITSAYVPGSPFATMDTSIDPEANFQISVLIIVIWLLVDIAFHVLATLMQFKADRNIKAKRLYYPSPMPMIEEYDSTDYPGSRVRVLVGAIYLVVSGAVTFLVCILMITMPSAGRGFGEMSCSHTEDGKFSLGNFKGNCA